MFIIVYVHLLKRRLFTRFRLKLQFAQKSENDLLFQNLSLIVRFLRGIKRNIHWLSILSKTKPVFLASFLKKLSVVMIL